MTEYVSKGDTSPLATVYQETVDHMLNAIRSATLRKLVIVYKSWQENRQNKGGLAALIGECTAPPTQFIMEQLGCQRRCAHDYRLAIEFLLGQEKLIALSKVGSE
jgi:hypothetical protein